MKRGKKAQGSVFGMSFGMIFSIFLIIFFVVVAFIAINSFLNMKKCIQLGTFYNDLSDEVDKAFKSERAESYFPGKDIAILPSNIKWVCFANFSEDSDGSRAELKSVVDNFRGRDKNMFFYPIENACDMPYLNLEDIDIEKMTATENPYCIPVDKGKISIKIAKERRTHLVVLTKV